MLRLIQLVCIVVAAVSQCLPSFAQMDISSLEQQGRRQEAQGDYTSAGRTYLTMLKSTSYGGMVPRSFQSGGSSNTMSEEQQRQVARRALACLTRATRDYLSEHPGDFRHCTAYLSLGEAYNTLVGLEPNNPSWMYLQAVYYCAKDKYVDADHTLRNALNTTGGPDSVRQKCKALLAQINPIVVQRVKFDRKLGYAMLNAKIHTKAPTSSSPSQYEQDAASRARQAGDGDAVYRFMQGRGSDSDWRRYGGP